jgi:hypothetical protein
MTYAILTPSFAKDFDRCRFLAESIEKLVSNSEHYILVDPIDLSTFAPLRKFCAKIIDAREFMDTTFRRVPMTRLYLTPEKRIVHGWLTQQMRKMAFTRSSPFDCVLCVDSDVVFVKPFDPGNLTINGKTPLFEIEWSNDENVKWANQARQLLNLPIVETTRGYVHPTFWRRTVMEAMLQKIQDEQGCSWQLAMSRFRSFSEYMLYGIFIRESLGLEAAGIYPFNRPIMHLSWDYDISIQDELAKFITALPEESVAAMFHSKNRVHVREYENDVRKLWAKFG